LEQSFLGNRTAIDVAFDIDAGGGARAIVGVEMKYHEHAKTEDVPTRSALARYLGVGAFGRVRRRPARPGRR